MAKVHKKLASTLATWLYFRVSRFNSVHSLTIKSKYTPALPQTQSKTAIQAIKVSKTWLAVARERNFILWNCKLNNIGKFIS